MVITHNAAIAAMADRVIRLADARSSPLKQPAAQGWRLRQLDVVNPLAICELRSRASCEICWTMKAQALAFAMVVAAGVAMYVLYLSNFASLRRTLARLLRA